MLMLADTLLDQLGNSLQRLSSDICSRWANNYMILGKPVPGPMRFDFHPWARTWCDDKSNWIGKKAAQMGMTNACLARAMFTIDVRGNDVLYLLPKQTDARDFSKSKFDSLLENSDHLGSLFNNVKNIGHKQAGSKNLYIRGTRSRSALKTISVGLIVFDEFDEMIQANVKLASHRSAGYQQEDLQNIKISTPTLPKKGISVEFESTNKQFYTFRCPNCSRLTELIWPECLEVDDTPETARLFTTCHHLLNTESPRSKMIWLNEQTANWEPTAKSEINGYHINSFYSIARPLPDIAKHVIDARTDEIANSEMHNSILGKEYIQKGGQVTEEEVASCRGSHRNESPSLSSKLVTMGVDVGHKVLYYHIDEWLLPPVVSNQINSEAICRTLAIGVAPDFQHLKSLLYSYQVQHTCVDVDPAFREAVDFCERLGDRANLIRFTNGLRGTQVHNEDELVLQVNRTIWLDLSQGRYHRKTIILPNDLPKRYPIHISNLIRQQYIVDDNVKSKYTSQTNEDHWAFARVYSEIALPLALSTSEAKDIKAFL